MDVSIYFPSFDISRLVYLVHNNEASYLSLFSLVTIHYQRSHEQSVQYLTKVPPENKRFIICKSTNKTVMSCLCNTSNIYVRVLFV